VNAEVPLLREMRRFLGRLNSQSGVVVAVSGGPDSVALLRALLELKPGLLTVAHLNHQLRGDESDADEAFVRGLAAAHNLPFRMERIDVRAEAADANLEAAARKTRYDWLARIACQVGAGHVATGHTADDQAETVLHRLLRGTGLRGLRGIAARRPLTDGIELVRPLLTVPRRDVIAYLEAIGQPFRTDRSNEDETLTRNHIRRVLLPLLAERYNPAIARALSQLAVQAEEVFLESEQLTQQLLKETELPRAGAILVLDRVKLAAAPRHRVRDVLRDLWMREVWPLGDMTFAHWERMADVVFGEIAAVDLPSGIRFRARERVVQLGPAP